MVSQAEIDRLRLEADTIMTRYQRVEEAIDQARTESGEHWETGKLTITLDTPRGKAIDVTLELGADPASNAQSRYERVKKLEAELERAERIVGELAPLPSDPVAYLICYHLNAVEGNYPRSMAGHLDAERNHVESLCQEMDTQGYSNASSRGQSNSAASRPSRPTKSASTTPTTGSHVTATISSDFLTSARAN